MGDVLELLESRGGESSALSEIEQRGELFGNLEEANMNTERRREQERLIEEQKVAEAAAKAQAVQDQMERNMQAMQERGEKIEELDVKTKQLESEAKDFHEMATQLKEKMKAKNKRWF